MMVFPYPMDPMMVFPYPIDPMMFFSSYDVLPYPMDPSLTLWILPLPYGSFPYGYFPYPMMVFPYPMGIFLTSGLFFCVSSCCPPPALLLTCALAHLFLFGRHDELVPILCIHMSRQDSMHPLNIAPVYVYSCLVQTLLL